MDDGFGKGFHALTNPLVKVLSVVAAGLVLVGAFFVGAVILSVVIGVAVIGALVFGLRIWWLKRKIERAQRAAASGDRTQGELIEVEYRVLDERDEPDDAAARERRRAGR